MHEKKEAEIRLHATKERKAFEEQETKVKEKELVEKEWQMSKLEEEREQLKKDFENHERYLKEIQVANELRMKSQKMTQNQIDAFKAKEQQDLEERRNNFDSKDKSIEDRIQVLRKSKERMVSLIKKDNDIRLLQTQTRFKSNLQSYRQRMAELADEKSSRSAVKLEKIREEVKYESMKRQELKRQAIEKAMQKKEELIQERKREMILKNK